MENKFCDKCGSKLEKGQEFCSKCGKKNKVKDDSNEAKEKNKNRTKNIIIIAIVSVLVIVGLVIGIIIKNNNDKQRAKEELEQAVEKYKSDAYSFGYETLSSLADIESVGNDVKSYWYDYIYEDKYSSINDAVDKALEKNSELIETINDEKKSIEKDYKVLLNVPDENNSELNEIKDAVKDLYNDYYDFYDVVITPTGNYTSFTSDFSRLDSSGLKKYNTLNTLLGY
jgi:DNA-directed RNA polymerase subunit M/transcription elongation factor TFIIS